MIMSKNLRIKYTKMFLKNAILELLKEKPLNKITIQELCDKAEVNRSTFYAHYLDIYDLF